jgi:OOP family OmpA-OmpF porin
MNVVLGLTPRFKISRGLYFAVDTALVFNISQHYNFDGSLAYENTPNSFTGITYNVTGGIVYQIRNY